MCSRRYVRMPSSITTETGANTINGNHGGKAGLMSIEEKSTVFIINIDA